MLVTIAVIISLVALTLPGILALRNVGRKVTCTSNLRQQLFATLAFSEREQQRLPPAYANYFSDVDKEGVDMVNSLPWYSLSWRTLLLPELGEQSLFDGLSMDHCTLSEPNRSIGQISLDFYTCPSVPQEFSISTVNFTEFKTGLKTVALGRSDFSNVIAVDGRKGAWAPHGFVSETNSLTRLGRPKEGMALSDIADGLSSTALVVEQAARSHLLPASETNLITTPFGSWTACDDGEFVTSPYGCINRDNFSMLFSFHSECANVGFGDGHVASLRTSTDGEIVAALLSCDSQEVIDVGVGR